MDMRVAEYSLNANFNSIICNRIKKVVTPMATACISESHDRPYQERTIRVVNVTPAYRMEERERVKQVITEQLFEVFQKYASS